MIVKKYEEVINDSKENIQLLFKQGLIWENFMDTEILFETVDLSRFTICFKINAYTLVKKYSLIQNSTLSATFLKNNWIILKN